MLSEICLTFKRGLASILGRIERPSQLAAIARVGKDCMGQSGEHVGNQYRLDVDRCC